jgi:hypothetical protein
VSIAVAAFVLSVLALVWSVLTTVIRWPRFSVRMRQSVNAHFGAAPPDDVAEEISVVVVNTGAEGATIAAVGICVPHLGTTIDAEFERSNTRPVLGPDLPARIEAHGALVWTFPEESFVHVPRDAVLIPVAHRYRSYLTLTRKRRRDPFRRITGKVPGKRNAGPERQGAI